MSPDSDLTYSVFKVIVKAISEGVFLALPKNTITTIIDKVSLQNYRCTNC